MDSMPLPGWLTDYKDVDRCVSLAYPNVALHPTPLAERP